MVFLDESQKRTCANCTYIAFPPYPRECPKCGNPFLKKMLQNKDSEKQINSGSVEPKPENLEFLSLIQMQSNKDLQKRNITPKKLEFVPKIKDSESKSASDLTKSLKMKMTPDIIFADQAYVPKLGEKVQEIKISKSNLSEEDSRIKIKTNTKVKFDISQPNIILGHPEEHLKFLGIVTKNRVNLFGSNQDFDYFLELASNLEYIATSILSGVLDRMNLLSSDGITEETCFFVGDANLILVICGNFPDKKAAWLLNQIKINAYDLLGKKNLNTLEKMDIYNFQQDFSKRCHYILEEYINLQEVFTANQLKSLDNFLRVDYFGLSFESIGVISKMITEKLQISDLPPIDPTDENVEEAINELKEALITAKIEAIAANTVANTAMMPEWISVKLGFQQYRFILFSEVNKYYITLLAEGNLEYHGKILEGLKDVLKEVTSKPFIGILSHYQDQIPPITKFLHSSNQ